MEFVYIGLGSNLGDRENYVGDAVYKVSQIKGIELIRQSSIYETEPEGILNQPKFLNCVIEVKASLTPLQLLQKLQEIEVELGRVRTRRWGARTIDLDILFYGGLTVKEPNLEIPHPRIANRRFVLEPLAELIPDFKHPVLAKSMNELKEELFLSVK